MKNYKQIAKDGQAEITIKGSRFICHLMRVHTEEEALHFVNTIKKEHKKATHNCSAYLVGMHDEIQRAHDDGEPSRTAGVPMLEVLKKQELHNIAAVVTRYFGGVKLGAGGLIRAYSSSVSHTLNTLGLVMHTSETKISVTVSYNLNGKLDYFLKQSAYRILDTQYTDSVTYQCGVLTAEVDTFEKEITELLHGTAELRVGQSYYIDLPLESETVNLDEHLFE